MRQRNRWYIIPLVVAGIGSAGTANAQVRVEAGPLVGVYAPLGSFHEPASSSTGLPRSPADLTGPTLGAQGRLWLSPRLGVQLAVAAAYSRVGGGTSPGGVLPAASARVYSGTAQLLVNAMGGTAPRRLWLSLGAGVVNHGGDAYAPYHGRTHLAGALGIGAGLPIGGRLQFTAGLTTLLYGMTIRDALDNRVEHGTQFDAHLQAGLSWGSR